jgi:hypothetical protein
VGRFYFLFCRIDARQKLLEQWRRKCKPREAFSEFHSLHGNVSHRSADQHRGVVWVRKGLLLEVEVRDATSSCLKKLVTSHLAWKLEWPLPSALLTGVPTMQLGFTVRSMLLWFAALLSLNDGAGSVPHLSLGMHLVNVKETRTTAVSKFQTALTKTFQDMVASITIGQQQKGLSIRCQVDPYGAGGVNLQLKAVIALSSCEALRELKSKVIEFTAKDVFQAEVLPAVDIHCAHVLLVSTDILGCARHSASSSSQSGGKQSKCSPGRHRISSGSCVDCSPGKFSSAADRGGGEDECKYCLLGLYQSQRGQVSCNRCPANSLPASNRTTCYTHSRCGAGKYGTLGGVCTACPVSPQLTDARDMCEYGFCVFYVLYFTSKHPTLRMHHTTPQAGKFQAKGRAIQCSFCSKGKYQV